MHDNCKSKIERSPSTRTEEQKNESDGAQRRDNVTDENIITIDWK